MPKYSLIIQRGQGLIDMILVVLFIAVGVIAMVKFQNYLAYSTNTAQQRSDASLLASNQIEILRDFEVLTTQTGYSAYQDIASGSYNTTVGNTTYSVVSTVTPNTTPIYKNIDVTVSWTDRLNGTQSVRLITQVAGIDPAYSARIMK